MSSTVHRRPPSPARRLRGSAGALFAVALASTLILVAARPLPLVATELSGVELADAGLRDPATLSSGQDRVGERTRPAAEVDAAPATGKTHTRRSRQTLAMPYFSFAARS